eukprot:TRINITY_DN8317_c0_g1_i1.p1 TRINITY_DN8317_c0_g1~~TRINITY_DN8317_c0_g1_i1.p1  ORF type:complete len:534 (+),score=71.58 TRINITY_DN8317_c0_g1_i1:112-1713(+)
MDGKDSPPGSKDSQDQSKSDAKPPSKKQSTIFSPFVLVTIGVIGLASALFAASQQRDLTPIIEPHLLGDSLQPVPAPNQLNQLERDRWNLSVPFSFPGSKKVPGILYQPYDSDFIDKITTAEKLQLIAKIPISHWPAFAKWKDVNYVAELMPVMTVHAPAKSVVRMHSLGEANMFGRIPGVKWARPWIEEDLATRVFYNASKLAYFMSNIRKLPEELDRDFGVVGLLTLPWSPPMEINLWMGVPTVTTPAHYDLVHNFYTQVVGHKRFILFPPEDAEYLHTFNSLHPSARQSQIDFNDPKSWENFPDMKNLHPQEVILKPGDVLYIPPYHFHYVCVVGDSVSMSISTHTESQEAKIYERSFAKANAFFNAFWGRYPMIGASWSLSSKSVVLREYIRHLYQNETNLSREAVVKEALRNMISAHWSHFELDKDVQNLTEKIEEARKVYPSDEEISKMQLSEKQQKRIFAASDEISKMYYQDEIKPAVRVIMMQTHIEEIAGSVLTALPVDPFFRYAHRYFENAAPETPPLDGKSP